MLDLAGVNPWAVALVWLVYVTIGAFWYSPAGFAKQWTKLTGIDIMKLPKKDTSDAIRFVALSALVQSFTLAVILHSLHATALADGLFAGVVLWLGVTAATTVGVTFYSQRTWGFLWLNSSYFLVVMTIGSIIFTLWQ